MNLKEVKKELSKIEDSLNCNNFCHPINCENCVDTFGKCLRTRLLDIIYDVNENIKIYMKF